MREVAFAVGFAALLLVPCCSEKAPDWLVAEEEADSWLHTDPTAMPFAEGPRIDRSHVKAVAARWQADAELLLSKQSWRRLTRDEVDRFAHELMPALAVGVPVLLRCVAWSDKDTGVIKEDGIQVIWKNGDVSMWADVEAPYGHRKRLAIVAILPGEPREVYAWTTVSRR